ncbi:MAG: PIN domain-containing protein [Anaerolineales bacterium]|nr:PIN domain-containing protein [Anaerolineales bacterium]
MNDILVDTSVWSLALRRPSAEPNPQAIELQNLITDLRVVMIGPIRQELLSGIRHPQQYQKLRNRLQAFPDLVLAAADYELAAEYFNICRSNGVQGSNTDFLICAVAVNHQLQIFTTDQDFELFQQYLPIGLYKLRP